MNTRARRVLRLRSRSGRAAFTIAALGGAVVTQRIVRATEGDPLGRLIVLLLGGAIGFAIIDEIAGRTVAMGYVNGMAHALKASLAPHPAAPIPG